MSFCLHLLYNQFQGNFGSSCYMRAIQGIDIEYFHDNYPKSQGTVCPLISVRYRSYSAVPIRCVSYPVATYSYKRVPMPCNRSGTFCINNNASAISVSQAST